jgi:hypothetical protein
VLGSVSVWGDVDNSIGIGDLAAIITAAGITIYVLGLVGLALTIRLEFTEDLSTAWYAASLLPRTIVAGQGVRIWLGLPIILTVVMFLIAGTLSPQYWFIGTAGLALLIWVLFTTIYTRRAYRLDKFSWRTEDQREELAREYKQRLDDAQERSRRGRARSEWRAHFLEEKRCLVEAEIRQLREELQAEKKYTPYDEELEQSRHALERASDEEVIKPIGDHIAQLRQDLRIEQYVRANNRHLLLTVFFASGTLSVIGAIVLAYASLLVAWPGVCPASAALITICDLIPETGNNFVLGTVLLFVGGFIVGVPAGIGVRPPFPRVIITKKSEANLHAHPPHLFRDI